MSQGFTHALTVPVPVTQGGTGLIATTANQILYSSATNIIAGLATSNNGVLITSAGGVPSISSTLPSGIAATNMSLTTPSLGVATANSINFGGGALNSYTPITAFTPGVTFTTPGNLSVSYAIRQGYYWRIGSIVFVTITIRFTPTYTTATGSIIFNNLPISGDASTSYRTLVDIEEATTYPVGTTQIIGGVVGTTLTVYGIGSATAIADFTTTQITSAVQRTFTISGWYGA